VIGVGLWIAVKKNKSVQCTPCTVDH